MGTEGSPEATARLRESMGLNRPLAVQYVEWLARAVRGDLGVSIQYDVPVGAADRHPAAGDAAAHPAGGRVHGGGGDSARALRGHPPPPRRRLPRDGRLPARDRGALVLGGAAADPLLLRHARLGALGRLRRLVGRGGAGAARRCCCRRSRSASSRPPSWCAPRARPCSTCCARTTCARRAPRASASALVVGKHTLRNAHDPHRDRGRHPARPAHGRQPSCWSRCSRCPASAGWPSAPSPRATCRWCRASTLFVASCIVLINFVVDLAYGFLDPRIRYE